jgi:hypothetical protein
MNTVRVPKRILSDCNHNYLWLGLATYDSSALGAWYSLYGDVRRPPANSGPSRYKTAGTPPFPANTLPSTYPGTVDEPFKTSFFKTDDSTRTARWDFEHSLGRFLDSQYASPKWWTRKGLIGWDLFSEIDNPEIGWAWDGSEATDISARETTEDGWVGTMADYMGSTETVRLGSRRLRTVSVGNLLRFHYLDPERIYHEPPNPDLFQALYLDNPRNDYIDYHLYTFGRTSETLWFTEYPSDSYTPIKYYLGVDVGAPQDLATSGCTLPQIIDHNRYVPPGASHRVGGFFSSEFGLRQWEIYTDYKGYPRKRFLSDCNHNYLWLGLATGSIGGPTPWRLAGSPAKDCYDLSGINYLNPTGEALNYYTDEILDSMLSLNRFTSLVNWKLVDASYRPMRITKDSGGPSLELRSTTSGLVLPENEWLWSAASDKTFTVGWIVRNCPRNYEIPESSDSLTAKPAPRVHITGLQATAPTLELVWFDDHLGQIVGSRAYSTSGTFNVVTPNTEGKNGLARSIAFLIQPTGLTANASFAALPDEKIGQIEVSPRVGDWYEEYQQANGGTLTFKARTKPAITNPSGYTFEWRSYSESAPPIIVYGNDQLTSYCSPAMKRLFKVDIKDSQNKRVSGDITYLDIY